MLRGQDNEDILFIRAGEVSKKTRHNGRFRIQGCTVIAGRWSINAGKGSEQNEDDQQGNTKTGPRTASRRQAISQGG